MKQSKKPLFVRELVAHRVDILAEFYDMAESALVKTVKKNPKKYPAGLGHNKGLSPSLWLDCIEADRIIEEAGLVNPLFKEDE